MDHIGPGLDHPGDLLQKENEGQPVIVLDLVISNGIHIIKGVKFTQLL